MRTLVCLLALAAAGCSLNLVDASPPSSQQLPQPVYTGANPNPWYLYQDALNGGDWLRGLDFFSGGSFAGSPVIDLADKSNPHSGTQCMRFSIPAQSGGWYCGMILLQGSNFGDSAARPGVDATGVTPAFSQCVFYARAPQGPTQVKFEAFSDGVGSNPNNMTVSITPQWTRYALPLSSAADMAQLKQFFTIVFANSAPATASPIDLYIDDLRYE